MQILQAGSPSHNPSKSVKAIKKTSTHQSGAVPAISEHHINQANITTAY